jgi:AraC family transcriptional regulator, regulatory protein of adaptative response / methylated-DNA-[protein]-cysteine methyltransferase
MISTMNERMSDTIPDEATCWQAVMDRDSRYAGQFYFGVRSTRIYCRPGCPARSPRQEQVTYFASGAEARSAGYRPCRRCHPDELQSAQEELVARIRRLLEESAEIPSLAELARQVGFSPYYLQRMFKAATGLTPRQYASSQRVERLKQNLKGGQDVTSAMYEAGYGSASRLYTRAQRELGMTPGMYRKGGKGMTIHYTTFDTTLGRALLAATERGLCKVSFGNDDGDLQAQLTAEFSQAHCDRDDAGLAGWAETFAGYLRGEATRLDLPLDVQGTDFQMRVWSALRQIPYGQTRTYAQLAETIGMPAAVRAAAHACAVNPVAVVTPCHRIVRSDGGLGGYRWGLERKQKLLATEQS